MKHNFTFNWLEIYSFNGYVLVEFKKTHKMAIKSPKGLLKQSQLSHYYNNNDITTIRLN